MNAQNFDPMAPPTTQRQIPAWAGRRFNFLNVPFFAVMSAVTVMAAIYYAIIAAPMYMSSSQFTVQTQGLSLSSSSGSLGGGISIASLAGVGDIIAVQQYVQSHEMLEVLDKQFHLRKSYSQFRPDLLRWLPPHANDAQFLKFYQHMVTVQLDRESNIIEIDVRSFDRTSAPAISEALLKQTETFVDQMGRRVRIEAMDAAQVELNRAEAEAQKARDAVTHFRGTSNAVDPAAAGAQAQTAEAALDAQAAAVQAQLASALTYNKPDAPIVKQLQASLSSIKAQSNQYKSRQGQAGGVLPQQVTSYETLALVRGAAEQKVATTRAAFEAARAMADQHVKFVVRVVNPNRPDVPTEPRRLADFLMVILFALTGYAILSLLIAGIRDHRGV